LDHVGDEEEGGGGEHPLLESMAVGVDGDSSKHVARAVEVEGKHDVGLVAAQHLPMEEVNVLDLASIL